MKLTRRDFLKLGCLSVIGLAGTSMIGCTSQPGSNHPDGDAEPSSEEGANMNDSASNASGPSASGTAVVFFSCTGNTEAVAEKIAAATDGTLMRIEPSEPYSTADLDYDSDCRANAEQNSASARPALAAPVPDVANCDTVFLGYPIWWGKAPRVVLTFLEGADFAGKTIIPFCTSGSSPISGSIAEIVQAAPGADVREGRRFASSVSQQEITSWVDGL